jgi:hypothetical protein
VPGPDFSSRGRRQEDAAPALDFSTSGRLAEPERSGLARFATGAANLAREVGSDLATIHSPKGFRGVFNTQGWQQQWHGGTQMRTERQAEAIDQFVEENPEPLNRWQRFVGRDDRLIRANQELAVPYLRREADEAAQGFAAAGERRAALTPELSNPVVRGLYGGGQSLVNSAPALGLSVASGSPLPGVALMGAQSGGEQYGRVRERGGTVDQATTSAVGVGAVEAGTELLPMGFLAKRFGKTGLGDFVSGMLIRDLPGEQVATFAQDAIDTAIANPDMTWKDFWAQRPEAARDTALASLTQTAVLGGASSLGGRLANSRTASPPEPVADQGEGTPPRPLDPSSQAAAAFPPIPIDPSAVSAASIGSQGSQQIGGDSRLEPARTDTQGNPNEPYDVAADLFAVKPGPPRSTRAEAFGSTALASFPDLPLASRGGLREAPRPGAVPAADTVGREAYTGERLTQIGQRLNSALGLTVRKGRMSAKGALGQYDTKSGVIRTKVGPEFNVVAHEGGHALEMKLRIPEVERALSAHGETLKQLAYEGAAPGVRRQEGFAEWFRWYATNPAHAKKVAPQFYGDFEAALGTAKPELLRDLREMQSAYQGYLAAPSSGLSSASVVTQKHKGPITRHGEALKANFADGTQRIADETFATMYDRVHPINVGVRELKRIAAENGRTLPELKTSNNPYRLGRLANGSYASAHMNITSGIRPYRGVDPEGPALRDALQSALGKQWKQQSFDDFGGYLMARRMAHEWRRYEAGELSRPPDMLSRENREQTIKDFEAAHPNWRQAAQQVTEWSNNLWRKRYEAGLIGEQTYLDGLNNHPDYVPAQRDFSDDETAFGGASRSGKFAGGADEFKGSDRPFVNPVQSLMRESYELEGIIARNEAMKALQDLSDAAGPGSGAIVEVIPTEELRPIQIDALEAASAAAKKAGLSQRDQESLIADMEARLGDDTSATVFQSQLASERGEPIVYAWRDGKRIAMRLADGALGRQMYDAILGMTPPQRSMVLDAAAAVSHAFRFGVTTNAAFTLRNFIRDQFAAWMLTDVGYKPFASGMRGVAQEAGRAFGVKSPFSERYSSMGGLHGGANLAALGETRKLSPNALQTGRPTWGGFFRGVAKVAEVAETGTRLGIAQNAFRKAKKSGMSDYDAMQEAIFEARDFFDTDLHGSRMLAAKRILPFFNANMQGMRKAVNVATAEGNLHKTLAPLMGNKPWTTPAEKAAYVKAYKLWTKMAVLGVLGGSLSALYLDDPEFAQFDEFERATHWMVKANGEWFRIPKPFELAALSNIFERAVERFYAEDRTAWEKMRRGLAEITVPPVETPALSVPFEIARNRDYAGRPIVPDHLAGAVDPVDQANSYTSEIAKRLGRMTGTSPAQWDHAIAGFFGTWGRDAERLSNLSRPGERPAMAREDMPVISGVLTAPERGTASASTFWNLMANQGGKFTQAEGSFRQRIREGDTDGALANLSRMEPAERDYVLSQVFSEEGLGKLHPMERARLANGVLSEIRRDIGTGREVVGANGRPIQLTAVQRRAADEALAGLQMAEMSNGLTGAGIRGWDNRDLVSRREAFDRLEAVDPQLSRVLSLRMAAEKIPSPAVSAQHWPRLKARLDSLSERELRILLAQERAQSPSSRVDETLRRLAGNR